MEFRSTGGGVGMEVLGADFRHPPTERERQALREALPDAGFLLIRGQHLDERQFVDFAKSFGEIEPYGSTMKRFLLKDHPDILVLSNIVDAQGEPVGVADAGSYWHTDRSYVPKPAWASCLLAREVPRADDGTPLGDTEFASMTAAAQALEPGLRRRLEGLSAWHEYVFRFTERNDSMPGVQHPVILSHPLTGKPCLYVNKGFTHRLLGVPASESDALLEQLYEHARRAEFIHRHRWQEGDLLLWDNYSTQHRATGGYALPQRRLMWRTTIQGFALH